MAGRKLAATAPRPASSACAASAAEALAVPRPHTADGGFREVDLEICVQGPPGAAGGAALVGRKRHLATSPGGRVGGTPTLGRKAQPHLFCESPTRTASKQERYARMGGPVTGTTGIYWKPQRGPYLTSLLLESPRSPDFIIDMCMEDELQQTSPQREALRAGLSRLAVRSPFFGGGKQRARLSGEHEGLAALTAEMELLARKKADILREADNRSRFTGAGEEDELEDSIQMLIQRNLKHLDQEGFPELNTLKLHESAAPRVRQTSEHLVVSKGEAKAPVKVKSYRARLEELEAKVATYRTSSTDRNILRRRARQHKVDKIERNGGGSLIADFRAALSSGAFSPEKKAELITLRATAEEVRLLAVQRKRTQQLAQESDYLIKDLQERAERKEAMRIETERKRLVARNMQLVQVLLPAIMAGACFELWSKKLVQGRLDRIYLQECEASVRIIQRYYKWRVWRRNFQNKLHAKRILHKYMWYLMMQWRIRRKSKAVKRIVVGMREFGQTLEVVAAFARYKYRIRLMQRQVRATLAAKHSQLEAAKHQYRRARAHYKSVQISGGDDVGDKKKKKKKGEAKKKAVSEVQGVNFMLLADANSEIAESELSALVKMRRDSYAQHLMEWRKEYQEWKSDAKKLQIEVETERMVGKEPQDYSQEEMPSGYPFLFDSKDLSFSWGRFLQMDASKRKRDDRYRLRGPPRPLLSVALHEELELFPLFHRIREQS
jgi:hypothetical protein